MKLRVLHIGNIANNAYNVAKALREKTDIEADVFTHFYNGYISQPEWEDVDFEPIRFGEFGSPDWTKVNLGGFKRPDWYFEDLDQKALERLDNFSLKPMLRSIYLLQQMSSTRINAAQIKKLLSKDAIPNSEKLRLLTNLYKGLVNTKFESSVDRDYFSYLQKEYKRLLGKILTPLKIKDINESVNKGLQQELHNLFSKYDIIQAYGVWEPMYPLLLTPSIPLVTFEHGSMREHPFMAKPLGRLLALAYKKAFKNLVTNGDAIHSIKRLGLNNYAFLPHPVDDNKFYPHHTNVRKELLEKYKCSYILFAPSRQNWRLKGNDKALFGFAKLLKYYGKGIKLFVCDWGQEMDRSKRLAKDLGVEKNVVWLLPLCKRRLSEYYNASDIVLDQFTLGTFGTTTPEAMACGKPTALFYKPQDHEWCFNTHPPIVNAFSPDEICECLKDLIKNPGKTESIGKLSREWYKKHYSIDIVVSKLSDVYREIVNPPVTVFIPPHFKKEEKDAIESKKPVKKEKGMPEDIAAVIKCPQPSLHVNNTPRYLREVCDRPLIQIMADRLFRMPIKKAVLVTTEDEPRTIDYAKGLGWCVVHFSRRRITDVKAVMRLLLSRYVAVFDLNFPFTDPALFNRLFTKMKEENLDYIRLGGSRAYGPNFIVKSHLLIQGGILKIVKGNKSISWREVFNTVLQSVYQSEFNDQKSLVATQVTADTARTSLIKAMGGVDFTLDDVKSFDLNPGKQRKSLHREMLNSETPHLVNKQLNDLECKSKLDKLLSFPTFVGLNMTSVCDAQCTFCSYSPKTQKHRDFITLEDIKKMTWLKYVSTFAIWGGIGESLANPEFLKCYNYIKEQFPNLNVTFSGNGIKLNEETCEAFAGHLSEFNISLNAATRDTWESLMRAKGFDNILNMFSYLAELKKTYGMTKPSLAVSMVLVKENIHEAVDFVNLAYKIGAERVTFCHFVPTTLVGKRTLDPSSSLSMRAKKLGIQICKPLPFSQKDCHISYGMRLDGPQLPCADPWKTCYLTVDEDGNRQMIFCCSGFYYDIHYDKSNLAEEYFIEKIWNHPAARYFRKTVNIKGKNPICTFCHTHDRFDPESNLIYGINEKVSSLFKKIRDNPDKYNSNLGAIEKEMEAGFYAETK
jgi:glycosyltransferase involved in cell wall biosynthesis/MoaA/NifB/PqqE/SkfB family radical SAM enzyme